MISDHYAVLGLGRFADAHSVKTAFRRLAKELHPDLNPSPDAQDRFMRVREAYEVLDDPVRKSEYDKRLRAVEEAERRNRAEETARAAQAKSRPRQEPKTSRIEPNRASAKGTSQPPKTKGPAPRYRREEGNNEAVKLASLLKMHRYAEVDMVAERILRDKPHEAAAYAAIADVARYRGDLDRSARYYAYAAQFDPNNPVFERKYLEVVDLQSQKEVNELVDLNRRPIYASLVAVAVVGVFLVLAPETALIGLGPFALGLGHLVALLVVGTVTGACLAAAGLLDRLETLGSATGARLSPPVALGFISLVCYWAALSAYWVVGAGQRAFNPSISRLFAATSVALGLLVAFTWVKSGAAAAQMFLLGGNVLLPSSLVGWGLADVFRALRNG